jgi:RNA polymerase sigma-70 factor (ECF subfamily)
VTLGFLRILETLQPVERAVFLLHDVFDVPFDEIADTVDKSVPATRQIASRARTRVRSGAVRVDPEPTQVQVLAEAFLAAVIEGDVEGLTSLLTDDVVHLSDGGADHHAARRPVVGPDKVARLFVNLARRELTADDAVHWVRVNGQFGMYLTRGGEPSMLGVFGWRDDQVAESLVIVNPDKLQAFHDAWTASPSA